MKNWKKQTGVWIDTSKAIIVTLFDGIEDITEVQSGIENRIYHDDEVRKGTFSRNRHAGNETKFDEQKKNQLDHFLIDVLSQVKESDELYIFGPAETKSKLEQKIYNEKWIDFHKLKSVETASGMSPNQILANVKDFYKN
ncbi:hypothetical protein [Flavobacterium psychrotolerans]|uniref:Host attachment protein n=1 Tax=Flavobacterium psychrotolerans TaxID=2169410 RepID=A0A2U1JKZ2_9FLAO|nr:hypothetical protein [Flavobacterium psychrotolerans]PWA05812.1 hypothetical protein DB895_05140 [Flavobacterium psychrotolerans]